MQEIYFYQELSVMHMLAGDTSQTISIDVEGELDTEAAMKLIISRVNQPDNAVMVKNCSRSGNSFAVEIKSLESRSMKGTYFMDFILTNNGVSYKRIRGLLDVKVSPKET